MFAVIPSKIELTVTFKLHTIYKYVCRDICDILDIIYYNFSLGMRSFKIQFIPTGND